MILKTKILKWKAQWVFFTKETNKTALSSSYDRKTQSIDLIETYGYVTRKDLVSEKEEIKRNEIRKQYNK